MTRYTIRLRQLMLALLGCCFASIASAAETGMQTSCTALSAQTTRDFRIETAQWVDAGSMPSGPGGQRDEVPAHCLFRVVLQPRESGMENLSYGTGIELRLPQDWNGRLLFQGGGGFNGSLNPAFGSVPGATSALGRGFAVVSTDSGHRGTNNIDVRFGVDQQARLDFGYQSLLKATQEAKALIDSYYGRGPDYSYFMGCSTGGREALIAAQRLPLEFDGVVSGNAARDFTRLVVNQIWSLQTVHSAAPRNDEGQPVYSQTISSDQLQAVSDALLGQCDALDGLADGMINDFQACTFDPAQLQCGNSLPAGQQCLSTQQVGVLHDIFGGARNSNGELIYGSFAYDTGIAGSAWRGMHLGNGDGMPANGILGRDSLRGFILTPADFNFDPLAFDFDSDMALTEDTAAISDASAILHSTYVDRGGKMIIYHGLSDQAMSTGSLLNWYSELLPRTAEGPQDWSRLFLVPGMTHCGGGASTDRFDMLTAIQSWVEEGQAPEQIIATGNAFPGVTRPLCPYPKVARYDGGDPSKAASFSCR